MSFLLGISGPTGAGKTTIANLISQNFNVRLIPELLPTKLFYKFRLSPQLYCYKLQKEIIRKRLKDAKKCKRRNLEIFDRTIEEDREVFFKLYRKLKFLTKEQYFDLTRLSLDYESKIGSMDAFIFLTAKKTILKQRMLKNGSPVFLIQTLDLQLHFYKRWLNQIDKPVFTIDNTSFSISSLRSVANSIYRTYPLIS